jgi:hypothetical protein
VPRTIYALLVGIDLYPPPVPRLFGCVNDIDDLKTFLQTRAHADVGALSPAAFRRHVIPAGSRGRGSAPHPQLAE